MWRSFSGIPMKRRHSAINFVLLAPEESELQHLNLTEALKRFTPDYVRIKAIRQSRQSMQRLRDAAISQTPQRCRKALRAMQNGTICR